MLYIVEVEALGCPISHKVGQGLVKDIPLLEQGEGKVINAHFVDNSFPTILDEWESTKNMMHYL